MEHPAWKLDTQCQIKMHTLKFLSLKVKQKGGLYKNRETKKNIDLA